MKEYFISLLAIGFLSMLTSALCHDDKSTISKNVRLLCALAVICVAISPIKSFVTSIAGMDFSFDNFKGEENLSEYEDKYLEGLTAANEEAVKLDIINTLSEKFDIDPDNIRINLQTDKSKDTPELVKVTVILSKTAIFKNPYDIEKAIRDRYKCECDVAVE